MQVDVQGLLIAELVQLVVPASIVIEMEVPAESVVVVRAQAVGHQAIGFRGY